MTKMCKNPNCGCMLVRCNEVYYCPLCGYQELIFWRKTVEEAIKDPDCVNGYDNNCSSCLFPFNAGMQETS